jgi:FkbM family methyltransferase
MLGIVFDVGANVGSYSKKILEWNPQARIFAFEAQPKNYEILQSVSNLQAINLALGSCEGERLSSMTTGRTTRSTQLCSQRSSATSMHTTPR